MPKLLASQVEVGHSDKAHEVMLDIYIICIERKAISMRKALKYGKSDIKY